jgi:predicted ester cyclase
MNLQHTNRTYELEEKNIRIARLACQAFNTRDIGKVHEFVRPDYVNRVSRMFVRINDISSIPNQFRNVIKYRLNLNGPDEFIDTVKSLREAFDDLHYEEHYIHASKDKVITFVTISGKLVCNLFSILPTVCSFTYEAVHIFRIIENKVVEHDAVREDPNFMM